MPKIVPSHPAPANAAAGVAGPSRARRSRKAPGSRGGFVDASSGAPGPTGAASNSGGGDRDLGQEPSARQEQQPRGMLRRMWRRKPFGGEDPLDLVA